MSYKLSSVEKLYITNDVNDDSNNDERKLPIKPSVLLSVCFIHEKWHTVEPQNKDHL